MKRLTVAAAALAALVAFPAAALAGTPGAIFTCQATGQVDAIDPIVAPGVYPSAHLHRFYGGGPVATTETTADLRTKATTCAEPGNHSAFWTPVVYEDGVALTPGTTAAGGGKHALLYYRCVFAAAVCAAMQAFPDDTRLVEGNAHATTVADNPAFRRGLGGYRCGTGGGTFSPTPPTTCPSGVLVLSVTFGACLSADATATTDPVGGTCPAGYRPAPRIQQYFRFWIGTGAVGTVTLSSGDPVTLHTDYWFGWDRATFDSFMARCINANVDCGTNPAL